MAVWAQSTFEGKPDQHTVFSRSADNGKTWSEEELIPVPLTKWDNPDPSIPTNWIVWQKPERLSEGKYLAGFTHWVSPKVRKTTPLKVWWAEASVVSFMRFENIDENPPVSKIAIRYIQAEDEALQVGLVGHPDVPVAQEPSLVKLPDGRIFCSLRATTGSPWHTVSSDEGLHLVQARTAALQRRRTSPHAPLQSLSDLSNRRRRIRSPLSQSQRELWSVKSHGSELSPASDLDNDGVVLGFGSGRTDLAM